MMKTNLIFRIALSALLTLSAVVAVAQDDDVKNTQKDEAETLVSLSYCTSYDDLLADRWSLVDSVKVVTKSRTKQMWWGGSDFKFDSDNKQVRRLLKKEAVAVMYQDTLLLNYAGFKDRGAAFGRGYAHGYRLADGRLLITYCDVARISSKSAVAGMFGLIGALAVASSTKKVVNQDVCYIVTPGNKNVEILNDKSMPKLLRGRQDLWEEYQQAEKKHRTDADVVMPLLKKAGLLNL